MRTISPKCSGFSTVRSGACGRCGVSGGLRRALRENMRIEWRVAEADAQRTGPARRRGRSVVDSSEGGTPIESLRVRFATGGCTERLYAVWAGESAEGGAWRRHDGEQCPTYGGVWVKRFPHARQSPVSTAMTEHLQQSPITATHRAGLFSLGSRTPLVFPLPTPA